MTARAVVRVAFVIFLVLMVQQTIMLALRVGGVHPDLLWLLPITAALADGPGVEALSAGRAVAARGGVASRSLPFDGGALSVTAAYPSA